jgi:hypothetical protein
MATPETMTLAEFAAHLSVGRPYVTALRKADRLVLDAQGRVVVEASIARIAATASAPERATAPPQGYADARERREHYEAEKARMDYEERCGRLVPVEQVTQAVAQAAAVLRQRLEALPDQLAPVVAAEPDEQRCRGLLAEQIEALLADLAHGFSLAGQGGPGSRAPQ